MDNGPNNLRPLKEYTPEELRAELKTSTDKDDFDRIQEIAQEFSRRNKEEADAIADVDNFEKKEKEFLDKLQKNPKKVLKKDLIEFLNKDLKGFKSRTKDRIDTVVDAQNSTIARLQAKLKDTEDENVGLKKTLLEGPEFGDFASFKTIRLKKMGKRINKLKEANPNNPKKVLIYCMAKTRRRLLGPIEPIKRGLISILRKMSDTDIVKELKVINKRLEIDTKKDSTYRKTVKQALAKEIKETQEKYYEQLKSKIVG